MLARPGLPNFEYIKAESSQDVCRWMAEKGGNLKLLMGGTDLFVQMRDRGEGPEFLLDVKGLPGMQEIAHDKNRGLKVGAAVTFNSLSNHPDVKQYYPILSQAADTVGNYQLRNRATLGGNICNASPSADISPAALIYQGIVLLESSSGERQIPLEEFWIGPGKTTLGKDEFLKALIFPQPPEKSVGCYLKLGRSKMGDLAIVGVAVLAYPDPSIPAGIQFRIGINSTAPTAYRVPSVEEFLGQNPLTEQILYTAAKKAMDISAPIEDQRASVSYQKKMVRNLVYKGLKEVWEELN